MNRNSIQNLQRVADTTWAKNEKINSELFTLTYGAIVCQLLKDIDSIEEVNNQLFKMGKNIGLRLIDEFLAKSGLGRCKDFRETADVIAKVGFKMFLGFQGTVNNYNPKKKSFTLVLEDNPLVDFVELPPNCRDKLMYNNVLCGVIVGALEMVQVEVECTEKKSPLRGDETTEIKIKWKREIVAEIPVGEEGS